MQFEYEWDLQKYAPSCPYGVQRPFDCDLSKLILGKDHFKAAENPKSE